MSEPDPLVTVIATCFNHKSFVVNALESIRAQSYKNVELIIVDDHSTDGSQDVIAGWLKRTGTRAKFLAHRKNMGICRSRNDALGHASGKYVACISTDDMWLPERLAAHTAILEKLPTTTAAVYSDAYLMDETGDAVEGMFIERYRSADPPDGGTYEALLEGNFIPSLATLVRRSAMQAIGPYDERLVFEDWDMWLRLSQRYDFAYSSTPVARYRLVPTSLMRDLLGRRRAELAVSELRIRLKHVGRSAASDHLLGFGLDANLEDLYQHRHHRRCEYYRRVAEHNCNRRLLDVCRLARIGMPCAWMHRCETALRRLGRRPTAAVRETRPVS